MTNTLLDPLQDAVDRGLAFEPEQTEWLEHHIRNALMGVVHGNEAERQKSAARILAIANAAAKQTRPPRPEMTRCLRCDRRVPAGELGPGYLCEACSHE